jgi:O-antigen/teichoic acid export membrane protein
MTEVPAKQDHRGRRFVRNVLWNWLGAIVSLFIGLVLSPYLIAKLGPEGYGVWSITFSLVEYYWLFDLGFRSATLKFVAHYAALDDAENVRRVISTSVVYASLAAASVLALVLSIVKHIAGFFQIHEALHHTFETLLVLITLNWCLGLVFNVFNACLEAVQCFEYSTKASIVATIIRAAGWTLALSLGHGLIAIGLVTLVSQVAGYIVNYVYFRRVFPARRIRMRDSSFSTLREMACFGIHTFVMTISNQFLNQGAPIVIGHFLPAAFAGFYNLPVRLLQYTADLVGRIGVVTNTNASELAARSREQDLGALAMLTNRYCLVVFMPLAILLWTHGRQLLTLWVGAAFATRSASVLPILVAGYLIGVVGQFSAGMLLQGLGKHQRYARTLFAEAVVALALLVVVIPRWGIVGAAFVSAVLMIVNRGIVASWLVSSTVGVSFPCYVRGVYGGPMLAMLPVLALSFWLRRSVFPSGDGLQVFGAAVIVGLVYYALALAFVVDREHRVLLATWMAKRSRPLSATVATAR